MIWGTQALGIALLLRGRRAGGALALLASTVSLAAVAFDGDLAADGLGAGHIALQVAISATTGLLWVATAASLVATAPVRASSAG